MFIDAFRWYSDHAALLFVVLVGLAIATEQLRQRLPGAPVDPASTRTSAATSVTSALAFVAVKSIVSKLAVTTLALFVFENLRLTTLDLGDWRVWVGVFMLRDFIYFWVHRAEHRINLLWASHMVHHSPETIGFTTAVRVPWMEAVYKPWLGLWLPLIGFNPVAAIAMDVFAATIGQLYHTKSVRRMPVIEQIFVTPSAHRVHHGSNPEYIDKNFGAVFIVWDKLFGTFELEIAPVVYGIGAKRIDTPVEALVGGYPALMSEAGQITGLFDRTRYLLSAPS